MKNFFAVVLLIASAGIIISVMLQSPKSEGMGNLAGGQSNVFGKSGFKTRDAMLSKVTLVSAVVFMISALLVTAL